MQQFEIGVANEFIPKNESQYNNQEPVNFINFHIEALATIWRYA